MTIQQIIVAHNNSSAITLRAHTRRTLEKAMFQLENKIINIKVAENITFLDAQKKSASFPPGEVRRRGFLQDNKDRGTRHALLM